MRKNKRGANGSGTIGRRADGRWEGKYTVGKTLDGKQMRKSVYGKTQAECRRKLDKAIFELDEGIHSSTSEDLSVHDWMETYFDCYASNKVKPLTLDKYRQDARLYIYPYIGAVRLKRLETEQIQRIYNELLMSKAPKTVHNVHGVLHVALDKALKLGYIRINPCDNCELPKKTHPELNVLTTDEDIRAFFDAVTSNRYKDAIVFDFLTGLRIGELLGLTWDCVDFDRNTITINKQLRRSTHGKGAYYLLDSTKTDNTRTIIIPPLAINILKEVKEKQDYWRKHNGNDWKNNMDLVFTDEFGKHLCHYTVYRNFKNIAISIGLPKMRFHDLRHSFATICLEEGDSIKIIQERLGHRNANTTLNTYSHPTTEMQVDSAAKFERRLQRIMDTTDSRQISGQEETKPPETQ